MKRNLTTRAPILLALAVATGLAAGCQKASQETSQQASQTPPAESTFIPAAAPAAPAPKVEVCKLLTAAEVSALVGKTLIQDGCSYGLDPSAKEKALADTQAQLDQGTKRAAAGDMNGFMKGMMQAGANQQKTGATMMEQMNITVDASRDAQTEDEVKAIYAKTGGAVHGALAGPLAPENHGMTGVIEGADEKSGVGDWAFATNVASVNMGLGVSIRGRILEARKGPWRVTVSATVSPDPGTTALDDKLAGVAKALIAKL